MKTIKIGPYTLKNKVIAAPLAGISNGAYRTIMADYGVALSVTEMTSDKAILFKNKKTLKMTEVNDLEGLVSLQLFGDEVESLKHATRFINDHSNAHIIDLNAGCPVPKVVNSEAGAALMKTSEKTYELLKGMVEVSSKPISVKIRLGWDETLMTGALIAKLAEEAGVSFISVHGRTRAQKYNGKASLEGIKKIKESVSIPVFGNGDIKTPEDALKMIQETNVDAVMIGRGLLGNPWLIKQVNDYLETGTYQKEISLEERFNVLKRHATLLKDLKGETIAVLELRSQAAYYIKDLPFAKEFRKQLMPLKRYDEIINHINDYYQAIQSQD
jgi:nifR3 family TIM-barrel protein